MAEHEHDHEGHDHEHVSIQPDEETEPVFRSLRREFEMLGLAKRLSISRLDARDRRHGQPYTRVTRIALPDVQAQPSGVPTVGTVYVYQVWGYTLELQFIEEDFQETWEQHDLGQTATLQIAHDVARNWREQLVGEYDIK